MRIRPAGAHALLIEVDDPAAWFGDLSRRRAAGELAVVDLVPGARTLLLDGITDVATVTELLRSWPAPTPVPPRDDERVVIPVDYDGADLAAVARLWGTDELGAIARLGGADLSVAFCGFSPGFAYLTGLPAEWAVPRLATPRARVPAGSVGLADSYAGIYPTASPGGWRLVGRTDALLFDPDRSPPALLSPGRGYAWSRVRCLARARMSNHDRGRSTRPAIHGSGPRAAGVRAPGRQPFRCLGPAVPGAGEPAGR